jgi:hypothetical protein
VIYKKKIYSSLPAGGTANTGVSSSALLTLRID